MAGTTRVPQSVIVAFVVLALISVSWSIYWFTFRAKLEDDVAEFRATLAVFGMKLDCSGETWSGFPFRYELTCPQPRLHGEYEGRPTEVKARNLRLVMQAYNPFHVLALTDGPTVVNGHAITHATARASLQYDTTGNWDAAVEVPSADLSGAATADMLKLSARVQDGNLQLAADARNLKSAMGQLPALSAAATAETDAAFLSVPDIVRYARTSATPLTISSFKLSTGTTAIEGTGQLNLDSAGKLNGKLASNVNDLDGLLALLAPSLGLTPDEVTGARTVIGLIGGNKTGSPTKIDITAKDGELYFGPFKFADVPPLD